MGTAGRRLDGGSGGTHLPPLAPRSGSASPSKLAPASLLRGGSRDLAAKASEGTPAVARSALSGSSKAPFPPDRSFVSGDWDWTKKSRDLPAEVRPVLEDNKMLTEELRRYRQRAGQQEGLLLAHERTIAALQVELAAARQSLRECSVQPAQLLEAREFRKQLAERDSSIRQLQQRGGVLERAKAAAERRLGNDLAAERRKQAELQQQMKQMQEDMAEKEKQARFNKLHINQLYRRLEPLEAAVAAAAAAAQEPPPPPPPEQQAPPQPEPEERVMLCLVHLQPSAAEVEAGAARLVAQQEAQRAAERRRQAAAAVSIQAAARGFLARRRLAVQHAAATTIQAAARGYLVRRSLATVWEDEGEQEPRGQPAPAEPELPASERLLLRQRAAERQYRERAAAAKSKPQKRLPSAAPGSRGANTAPEAAARKRSMMASATPDAAGGRAAVDSRARPGNGALDSRRASSLLSPAGPAGGSRDGAAPTGAGAAGRRLSSVRDSGAAGSSGPAGQPSTSPSRRRQSNAHCLEEAGASPRTSSGSGSGHAARRASVRSNSMASSEGTTGPVWLPDGTCVPRLQLYDHEGRLESKPARVSLGFGSGAPRKAGRL